MVINIRDGKSSEEVIVEKVRGFWIFKFRKVLYRITNTTSDEVIDAILSTAKEHDFKVLDLRAEDSSPTSG